MRKRPAWIVLVALGVAAVVGAAAVEQSLQEQSLQPIWTVGWIPAALVAALGRPYSAVHCRRRRSRP